MYYPLNKCERILVAGLELFAKHGFETTTVAQIARGARVGLSTFYSYFGDKRQLLNAIYRELRRRLEDLLDLAFHAEDPPRHLFHQLWAEMVSFDQDYPSAIAFLEHRHYGAYLDEESQPLDGVPQPIIALVERLGRENAIKNGPPIILAAAIWGTFVELVKLASQGRLALSPEKLQAAEDFLWDGLRAPTERSTAGPPASAA